MLFLKQPLILPFPYHKSATTCQFDSNKVSSSKLKSDLCNGVKTEILESTAPPQQLQKRGSIFGHSVEILKPQQKALLFELWSLSSFGVISLSEGYLLA